MTRLLRHRPSPAMAVALVALFVALGGVSYGFATGSIDSREIKNNTIRSKDVRNNTLRTRDIRNNEIRGRDIRNSTITSADVALNTLTGLDINEAGLGPVPNALALGGQPPSAFAPATAVRFATLDEDGDVIEAKSQGVTDANVTHTAAGRYCIDGLSPAPRAASVTPDYSAGLEPVVRAKVNPVGPEECEGQQIGILTEEGAGDDDFGMIVAIF